jgi:hypothetical protein
MPTPGTDTARTAAKSVIDLLQFNQGLFTRAIATAQEESLNFVNQRLQANRETIEKARAARGLDSFLTVQREWMLESARDYMNHSMRFADRMMELAEKGREEGEERVQAASDSFRTSAARDIGRAKETYRQGAHAAKSASESAKSVAEKTLE